MRKVLWEDRNGWKHVSLLRDDDSEELASSGIPLETVDTSRLDCERLAREVNNLLLEAGIYSWPDALKRQGELEGLLKSIVKRQIIPLIRQPVETQEHEEV